MKTNVLYYGDNLDMLRQHISAESVDLIYLDPPFNSNRSYNVLFRESSGAASEAQIEAFEDAWDWVPDGQAPRAYDEVMRGSRQDVAAILGALVRGLGHNKVTAYLCMMTTRLIELHRILKPSGSLYLHCDPTTSHYLKLLLDAVFEPRNFLNEISWERFNYHADAKRWGRLHDVIFCYAFESSKHRFHTQRREYAPEYIRSHFKPDEAGRLYRLDNALADGKGPSRVFFGKSIEPPHGTHWRWSQKNIDRLISEGRVVLTSGGKPAVKRYLDEMPGHPIGDIWTDIPEINSQAKERLGFNTQKPLALLERIVAASSNPGDVVLDPFCGCGTAVHAAHRLDRCWIGMDITYLAINLIERRMRDAFPGMQIEVIGEPKDIASAHDLARRDKWQFQWWALAKIDAQPVSGRKKKGADRGKDGVIPVYMGPDADYRNAIVSVKGGEDRDEADIRDLRGTMEREGTPFGVLLTLFPPTKPMLAEAASAGQIESTFWGRSFPKIQIYTIEDLFAGRSLNLPKGKSAYAKAPLEKSINGTLKFEQ